MNALLKLGRSNRLCRVSGSSRAMGLQDGNSLLPLLIFILFFACICKPSSSQLMSSRHDEQDPCATANCGKGTCREAPVLFLGYTCDCFPGWTMPRYGPLVWPSCILPNCTIDNNQCSGEPPTPPPPFQPLVNISSPCLFPALCGDGVCVASGTSYQCQCPQGSGNILGLPNFPCVQQCSLGVNCHNLSIGPPATSSSAPSGNGNSSSPSPSASPGNGATTGSNRSRSYRPLSWMLLAAMFVWWI